MQRALASLTSEEVARLLINLDLQRYAESFRKTPISGADLILMTDEDLQLQGIDFPLHRRRLKVQIDGFAENGVPPSLLEVQPAHSSRGTTPSASSSRPSTAQRTGGPVGRVMSFFGSRRGSPPEQEQSKPAAAEVGTSLTQTLGPPAADDPSASVSITDGTGQLMSAELGVSPEDMEEGAPQGAQEANPHESSARSEPAAPPVAASAHEAAEAKPKPKAAPNAGDNSTQPTPKGGEKVEQEDEEDDEDDFTGWFGFGGDSLTSPKDALSQTFDMRLGELPNQVEVFADNNEPILIPELAQEPSSKLFHLVVPPGGYVKFTPAVKPRDSYASHLYWSVYFDVQYTVTGEGGGFALFTPWDEVTEGTVPFFVRHVDGVLSTDTPPVKAPDVQTAVESEDPEVLQKAKKEALKQRLEEAAEKSKEWHRITVTGGYDTDTITLYVDGLETARKSIYFSSEEYPCFCKSFYLFACANKEFRPKHNVHVRLLTFKTGDPVMDKDSVFQESERVNHDLPIEKIESVLYERAMRRHLYVPQLPGRLRKAERQKRALTSFEPPTVWNHSVTLALFNVPVPGTLHNSWAIGDAIADLVDMVNVMVEREAGQQNDAIQPKVRTAFSNAMLLVRKSVKPEKLKGIGEDAARGESKISEWETNRRKAVTELRALDKLEEGQVHLIALKRPDLRFAIISKSRAQPQDGSSGSYVYTFTLISTNKMAFTHHPQRATGQRLLYNTCLELSGIDEQRMRSELWWTMFFMVAERNVGILYKSVLPWLVQRPLEDLESSNNDSSEQGRGHWVLLPKEEDGKVLVTIFEALRYLMLSGGCSVEQVDRWFLQLQIHLVVACASDLEFFQPSTNTLEEKAAAAVSHMSKTIAFDVVQQKDYPVKTLHHLQQALHSIQKQLRAHANMRRPSAPALLTLRPTRKLEQQHLHWGFDTLVPRDVSEQAGDSSFDKTLSGLKAVSFFESGLKLLHGESVPDAGEDKPCLNFSDCLQAMQKCLELCLQLSNLEDVKWRSHLMCAALADTFLKQLPLPLPASHKMGCVWASMTDVGEVVPKVAYTLELLRQLMELLAFASGSGALTGDDAAEWHSTLVCVSGAIAAISDAVARSGADSADAPRLAALLCGKLGSLHALAGAPGGGSEDLHEGKEISYSIGSRSFEARTNSLVLTPDLCLARKHILEYFCGLNVDPENELFDVEAADHYSSKICPTRLFFVALSQNIYCRSGAALAIIDVDNDMQHATSGHTAFRDIMIYWKIFTLTCDPTSPFECAGCKHRKNFSLVFQRPQENTGPYFVGTQFERDGSKEVISFLFNGCSKPIRPVQLTATNPTFHTSPHNVENEDDVLHLRRLPDFDGRLRPHGVELLLQYLTVPYLRIPLILDFFSEDTIYALQSSKLQELIERVLFEPGPFGSNDELTEPLAEVPCKNRERVTCTSFGLLFNELVHNGGRLVDSITSLLKLSLKYDAYRADDSMSSVILFITRLAVRIEQAATLVLSPDQVPSHDRRLLAPRDPHGLLSRLIELRVLLRNTVTPVLKAWVADLEKGHGSGGQSAKHTSLKCDVHAHLLYLHSNLQPYQFSKEAVTLVLTSFMQIMHGYSGATILHVPLCALFQIFHQLRVRLIAWLEADSRRTLDLQEVLNLTYEAATGQLADGENGWAKMREMKNRGRYALLDLTSESDTVPSTRERASSVAKSPLVNEENETTVAELNLQVMQVAAAGAVIKPLPEAYKTNQDVVEVLASFGALQAAVEDVRKNMSRYHIVGRGVWLELWNKDETLKQLKELNEKEKNKKKKLLDGEEIGDEFQMNEGQERWLASVGHLVRDSLRTTYTRKLDYKLVMSPLSYTFGGAKPTTTTEQPLKDHERWVYDLMDAADLTGQSFASFRNFANFGGIPGNDGERQKEDEKKKLFEKVSFYLPDEIDPDADIVRLVGGSEESEVIEIGDKTFGKQMFTYAGRYTSCTFEAYVQRRLNLVHVYQRVSHGREYFRTLVYSSNSELALVQLPKVRDSNNESDTGFSYLSGEYREKQERKAKIQRTEALKSNGSTDLLADPSCVITRNPPKLAGLPAAARRERYIPKWLLFGVLPENLLDEYHFYRQEKPAGAAQSISTELRGYAVRGSDSLSPHVLLVQLTEAKLRIFGGGNSSTCAIVKKRTLDGSVNDMMLLNLLTAEPNDDLSALGRVLMRLEHLAHILVWSTVHPHQNSRDQQFMVDLVELPRLQLSFKSKASKSDGESPRLYSVEMPQLYVYRPPKGEWPEDILHLVEDVPHGLVMLSDTQQLLLLVPNLKINRRGSVLIPERNEQWERSAITPYFIYEVHVSKQFFITTSLASALYLCIMRFLSEDYAACFILVDSIATDRAFDEEEQQIFELLALTDQRSHPNASACLCKIALAVEDAPVQLPVSIGYHAAVFVSSKPLISARCRLSEEEELRLMQLIHEQQLRATAADSVLKQSDNVIVKAATAGATPKPGAQAKMVEELHKNISAAASEAGVTMQMHEVPLLVTDWLNQQNERGAQLADAYDLKVLTNRRKQLCFRNAGVGSSMTPEDLIYAAHRNASDQKITGKSYTFARINAVLQTPAENWAKLNLRYDMERRITAQKLSDVMAKLIESPDSLDGTQHELGFLFLYDLMSGQMEVEANALNSDPSSQHELATLLIPFFSDTAPSSERQATSMLAELVALLASNKELVEVADRPRLDGSAFDGSEDSKIWRAQPIEKTSDEEDAKLPLGVLLEKLMEWLPQQRGLKWPAYISPAVSTFPVSADVLELGLFARRPIGVAVSDSACDLRKLERANLQLLQPTMTQLGIHFKETDLPLDISRQPMKELLAMKPGFTEEEKVVNETRASFGYNLENHRRVQTHIIAKSVVSRMQKDMAAFSFKEQNSTKLRVRDINKEFERLLGALCTAEQKNRLADCKKALGQIEKASQSLAFLQAALGAGQQKELEQVSNAIVLLGRLANHCSVPSPDTSAPHGLPDSEWRSQMLSRYHFSILHVGELDTDIDFTFIVQALLSRSAAKDWADINPFIDGDVQNELSKLAATMLLHASAISSFNLLIVETSKLQGMLSSMRTSIDELQTAVQETPGDKAVLGKIESKIKVATSGVVNLADSVASSLHVERHYISKDFTYDPRLLVFEFIRSLVLRRGQVEIAQDFILALRDDNIAAIADGAQAGDDSAVKIHRLAVQVLMGQGKTAVITPLLCLLLADGERVPIVLLPDSLLDAARNIIRSTFASVINKRVFTLECSRASTTAHRYLNMIQNAIKYKGVVITTPTSAKSAILKFLENLISLNDDSQIRGKRAIRDGPKPLPRRLRAALESHTGSWANLLQQFRSSVLIMDELDWVCHPMKSELNFPIGGKVALDFGEGHSGKRWEVALHLLDGFTAAKTQIPPAHLREDKRAYEVLRKLSAAQQRGFEEDALQRQPHTILLNDKFYRAELLPILADWMLLYIQAAQVGSESGLALSLLRDQILGSKVSDETAKELTDKLRPDEWKLLNLTSDWLHIFLPHCLKKVDRVTFGLLRQSEVEECLRKDPMMAKSRTRLAIPFVGKDVPSPAAEFAQPDVCIGLTILAYTLEGIRRMDLDAVVEHLQASMHRESGPPKQRPSCMLYSNWIDEANGEICGDATENEFRDLTEGLCLQDACLYLDSRRAESSSGALGDSIWRDLSGSKLDVDVAPALLARQGGHFECNPGSPLNVPHRDEFETLLRSGNFSISVVVQCSSDQGDHLSHLPMSIGGHLNIGASLSKESLSISMGTLETQLLYAPGQENAVGETKLHTFTFSGTELKYYVNGALVSSVSLPYAFDGAETAHTTRPRASTSLTSPKSIKLSERMKISTVRSGLPPIFTIGQTTGTDGSAWHFDGLLFLVIVHRKTLAPGEVQQMTASIMTTPELLGAARAGDGTMDGAIMEKEIQTMLLDRTVLFFDSRIVSHATMQLRLPSAARKSTTAPTLVRGLSSKGPAIDMPSREAIDETLNIEFTCAAVISRMQWTTHPYVLLTDQFFDGLGKQMRLQHTASKPTPATERGSPEMHHLVISRLSTQKASIQYYINGEYHLTEHISTNGVDPFSGLYERASQGRILGVTTLQASRAGSSPMSCRVHLFALYRQPLNDREVKRMAEALVEQPYTKTWEWGIPHRYMIVHGKRRTLGRFGIQFLRWASIFRDFRDRPTTKLVSRRIRPRVQPLFLLLPNASKKKDSSAEQTVRFTKGEGDQGNTLIWFFLPGHDNDKVTFKDRLDSTKKWSSMSSSYNRGNSWWTADVRNSSREHSAWVGDTCLIEGVRVPEADELDGMPASGTFPMIKGTGGAIEAAEGSMTALLSLLRTSQTVAKYLLSQLVFPTFMHFQMQKISASGGDLGGDLIFPRRIGFTGTPSDLLPSSMGKCGFAEGTEGEMVHTLTSLKIMKPLRLKDMLSRSKDWTSLMLLDMIAKSHPALDQPLHALIDTGALITGLSNQEVAMHLLDAGLPMDGVVYLGQDDAKMIFEKKGRRAIKLEDSLIPMEKRFCFYDQTHTTGTDIKHVSNAVACLTLGKDMNFRDYAQGAYRMRGIATGQRINVFLVPEVEELMRRELSDLGSNETFAAMNPEKQQLEDIACWLVLNSLDAECKQFNFLMQQDLANLYRRHSLEQLLAIFLKDGFDSGKESIGTHLASFRESLNLNVADGLRVPRSFDVNLRAMRDEHVDFIVGEASERSLARIFEKVSSMHFASEDGGLAQEQEQEQEEEKEQESAEPPDDQPIIYSDLAFARTDELQKPWALDGLADASMSSVPFYRDFSVHLGKPLTLPDGVHFSNHFFGQAWEGPRRMKNAIVMLEWIPTPEKLAYNQESVIEAEDALASQYVGHLWRLFARDGKLTASALRALLESSMHVHLTDEGLGQLLSDAPQILQSEGALKNLILGTRLRPRMPGRHFVAVSLREAETLRAVIHSRRNVALLREELCSDAMIGLRSLGRNGSLLDSSHRFPDLTDAQMKSACQTLRFVDHQTYFTQEETHLLLRALQCNDVLQRQIFHHQLHITHRRDLTILEQTPLYSVLRLPSELDLVSREAIALFLQLALALDNVDEKSFFEQIDGDGDMVLQTEELFVALAKMGLNPSLQDVWSWLQAADANENGEVSFDKFLLLARRTKIPRNIFNSALDWQPPVRLKLLSAQPPPPIDDKFRADLLNFVRSKQIEIVETETTRTAIVNKELGRLLRQYEDDEEKKLGPNPRALVVNSVPCTEFDFSRRNLPKCIEFHGVPDFLPETDQMYEGKQHFVLHELAYFYIRPILADTNAGEEPVPSAVQTESETTVDGSTREPLVQYSVSFHLRVNGSPVMPYPLISIVTSDDYGGIKQPAICLESTGIVCDNLSDTSSRKYLSGSDKKSGLRVSPEGHWDLLTIAVDNVYGKMQVYLNGEQMLEVVDSATFCNPGPFVIDPQRGTKLFGPGEMYNVRIQLRHIRLSTSIISAENARIEHGSYGIWKCSYCDVYNGQSSKKCFKCTNSRKKSVEPPKEPFNKTTAIRTVVGSTFKSEVLQYCITRGAVLLLLYSQSNKSAVSFLTEWSRVALLFASTPLRVCATELDQNEFDLGGLKPAEQQKLSACRVPGILLFRHTSVGGSPEKGFVIIDKPVVLDGALQDQSVATISSFLREHLNHVSSDFFNLDVHLKRCFSSYWSDYALPDTFKKLREQLLKAAGGPPHKNFPLRFLSMWLADPTNWPSGPTINSKEADKTGVLTGMARDTVDDAAKADPLPTPPEPSELMDSALFPKKQPSLDASTVAILNETLGSMMTLLLENFPREPFSFLSQWLRRQPLRLGSMKVLSHDDANMNHSEIVRCWPAVRKVVVGSPILSEVRQLIDSVLKPLLKRGLPIDCTPFGYTILYMASAQGNLEVAKLAAKEGADLHKLSKDGTSPLEVAASMGHNLIVALLLEQGAHFASALHYASAAGQALVVEMLLKAGCFANVPHTQPPQQANAALGPRLPLELALAHGHAPVVLLLLAFGATTESLPAHLQSSALLPNDKRKRAAEELSEQVSNAASFYELQKFLNSDRFDSQGKDMQSGEVAAVDINPNACDTMGWTGLMHAAVSDDANSAKKLLSLGALPSYRNRFALSAVLWAHWMEASAFREVLRQMQGAEADVLDGNDQKGFDRLRETLETFKGDSAVQSLLRPTGLRKGGNADAGAVSQLEKQEDGIQQTRSNIHNLIDEDDVPKVSLEEYLLELDKQFPKEYPKSGPFTGDMCGFINSMKLATMDIIASGTVPQGVTPADIFALHLYTRAELFGFINRAYREGNPTEMAKWRVVVWYMVTAKKRQKGLAGVYFRGVGRLFNFVPVSDYRPGKTITWGGFSSSSADLRIAGKFMYGLQRPSEAEGVIFKIWAKTPVPIEWCSFVPEEREHLFLPSTSFRVRAWYQATNFNLRRGVRPMDDESNDFCLACDHIVEPVPLQIVNDEEGLKKQLTHNHVLLVEMEETVLTEEEKIEFATADLSD